MIDRSIFTVDESLSIGGSATGRAYLREQLKGIGGQKDALVVVVLVIIDRRKPKLLSLSIVKVRITL